MAHIDELPLRQQGHPDRSPAEAPSRRPRKRWAVAAAPALLAFALLLSIGTAHHPAPVRNHDQNIPTASRPGSAPFVPPGLHGPITLPIAPSL